MKNQSVSVGKRFLICPAKVWNPGFFSEEVVSFKIKKFSRIVTIFVRSGR